MNAIPRLHNSSLASNSAPVYLIATLASSDQTAIPQQQIPNGSPAAQNSGAGGGGGNPNTGLAMIILYAITGCVTFMFLIVIVSGAIRAVRHPERYGPRARHDTEDDPLAPPPQTRAAGLGKAILDTFPVVKFGQFGRQTAREPPGGKAEAVALARIAAPILPISKEPVDEVPLMAQTRLMPMLLSADLARTPPSVMSSEDHTHVAVTDGASEPGGAPQIKEKAFVEGEQVVGEEAQGEKMATPDGQEPPTPLVSSPSSAIVPAPLSDVPGLTSSPQPSHTLPNSIPAPLTGVNNSMTCPICVCDFQDEDDIRVLPCDARHQFHKECVDPWLLNESRFCPLCRWDLSMRKDGSKIVGQPSSPGLSSQETERTAPADLEARAFVRPGWMVEWISSGRAVSESPVGRPQVAAPSSSQQHHQEQQNGEAGAGGEADGGKAARSRFVKYLDQVRQKRTDRVGGLGGKEKKKKRSTSGQGSGVGEGGSGSR